MHHYCTPATSGQAIPADDGRSLFAVDQYRVALQDMGRLSVIEEHRLAEMAHSGNQKARQQLTPQFPDEDPQPMGFAASTSSTVDSSPRSLEQLVDECQYYVRKLARKYAPMMRHTDVDDLVQIGMLSIIETARKKGTQEALGYYWRAAEGAMGNHFHYGRDDLLSRDLRYVRERQPVRSLDAPLGGAEEYGTLLDLLADSPAAGMGPAEHDLRVLQQALEQLTPKQREGLGQRFGLTGYGQGYDKERGDRSRANATAALGKLRRELGKPLSGKAAQSPVRGKQPLEQRRCAVCRTDLKRRIPGAVYEQQGMTFLVCRVCNCTHVVDQLGHAIPRAPLTYAPGQVQQGRLPQRFGLPESASGPIFPDDDPQPITETSALVCGPQFPPEDGGSGTEGPRFPEEDPEKGGKVRANAGYGPCFPDEDPTKVGMVRASQSVGLPAAMDRPSFPDKDEEDEERAELQPVEVLV